MAQHSILTNTSKTSSIAHTPSPEQRSTSRLTNDASSSSSSKVIMVNRTIPGSWNSPCSPSQNTQNYHYAEMNCVAESPTIKAEENSMYLPQTPTKAKIFENRSESTMSSGGSNPPFLLGQQDSPMSGSRTIPLTRLMPKKVIKQLSKDHEGWDLVDVYAEIEGNKAPVSRSSTLEEYEFVSPPSPSEVKTSNSKSK